MTALCNSRFFYINQNGNLYMEQKAENGVFCLAYGGTTLAYAYNSSLSVIALIVPCDLDTSPNREPGRAAETIVRLYTVLSDNLGYLVDERKTPAASQVIWGARDFLILSHPNTVTTILEVKRGRLRLLVEDDGVHPFFAVGQMGIFSKKSQKIQFWRLSEDKLVDECALSTRNGKQPKDRYVVSTAGCGNFAFILLGDGSLQGIYVTKGSIRKIKTLARDIVTTGPSPVVEHAGGAVALPGPVMIAPLSSSQVVVGVRGSLKVLLLRFIRQECALELKGSFCLPEGCLLVALSTNRCVVERIGAGGSITYETLALNFNCVPSANTRRSNKETVKKEVETVKADAEKEAFKGPEGEEGAARTPCADSSNGQYAFREGFHTSLVGVVVVLVLGFIAFRRR